MQADDTKIFRRADNNQQKSFKYYFETEIVFIINYQGVLYSEGAFRY